jgi:peptidoglycan-associated lipoprotein
LKTYKTHALLVAMAALLGACSSTPVAPPAPLVNPSATASSRSPAGVASGAQPTPMASSTVATVTLPAYLDPKSEISTGRSVFFDFDQALVKAEFAGLIERHGKYLIANPKLAIKIEGNTDERGSAEYNLALGQKRAAAVSKALKIYGVQDSQMEAISWGEEKPRAQGHDDAQWAQNRRADLQYPLK